MAAWATDFFSTTEAIKMAARVDKIFMWVSQVVHEIHGEIMMCARMRAHVDERKMTVNKIFHFGFMVAQIAFAIVFFVFDIVVRFFRLFIQVYIPFLLPYGQNQIETRVVRVVLFLLIGRIVYSYLTAIWSTRFFIFHLLLSFET